MTSELRVGPVLLAEVADEVLRSFGDHQPAVTRDDRERRFMADCCGSWVRVPEGGFEGFEAHTALRRLDADGEQQTGLDPAALVRVSGNPLRVALAPFAVVLASGVLVRIGPTLDAVAGRLWVGLATLTLQLARPLRIGSTSGSIRGANGLSTEPGAISTLGLTPHFANLVGIVGAPTDLRFRLSRMLGAPPSRVLAVFLRGATQ